MVKKQIVNIINFIRAIEPRQEMDLITPLKKQVEALEHYNLPCTFLLQYDALIDPTFTDILKSSTNSKMEIGVWLEIMKPLVEDAELCWRGREGFAWDWYANVGFSVGYTREERIKIIDTLFERFLQEFGNYPRSVGSWIIDAFSLDYMAQKYGITASCNCKDQWGTDGYTLWGGYYGQAYYPSRHNAYTPAQTPENQIPVPIFKMLGSDPIYQYDIGLQIDSSQAPAWQQVVTLEPVYSGPTGGGGEPTWVDWYFKENFNGNCIHFGYTQVGQENSFGWDAMRDGLTYQLERVSQLSKENKLQVMTLADSGEWYKRSFKTTPPTAIVALSDWKDGQHRSVWFNSKHYRLNVFMENDRFWIRDWHIFDEEYAELYMDTVCTENVLVYDNLPIMDGNRWSGNGIRAGVYPMLPDGGAVTFSEVSVEDAEQSVELSFETNIGHFRIRCEEDGILIDCTGQRYQLEFLSGHGLPVTETSEQEIRFSHRNHPYSLQLKQGSFQTENDLAILSGENGEISIT